MELSETKWCAYERSVPEIARELELSERQVNYALQSAMTKCRLNLLARGVKREHCYD